ncbi:MAG: tetratricopeptide repeat protein [Vicinamibacteria bacterium]
MFHRPSILVRLAVAGLALSSLGAQEALPKSAIDPRLYAGLTWRNVGPFRGGRVSATAGAVGQPGVFYAGYPGGGVWKTTSAGVTWTPVFDSVDNVSSIGAVAVAPSDADVVYVGTGDMITAGTIEQGNGVYKSTDAGKTWQHLGLEHTKHIPSISVDPRSADVVLLAAAGDPHRKSEERGIYRTTDGGRTWTRVLSADDETGGQFVTRAYDLPDIVFATTVRYYVPADYPIDKLRSWQFGQGTQPAGASAGTALHKSTDGGVTWRELSGNGLPRLTGRTSVAVAMNTGAQRVFLYGDQGLFRSDDGGANWHRMAADDPRIVSGGYMCGVWVDPKNPDVVYTVQSSSYKSVDGGKTFTGFKGAPGGDDPQQMWIDPTNGQRIFLGLDQGATISLDGGGTWSSWYNQSTEQIYHVAADDSFPYWIYATQQDAGAIRTRSRGNFGAVTMFDWNSVNGWEWGTIRPDPLNRDIVYSSGNGISKISYPSEQWIDVSPSLDPAFPWRASTDSPIAFAPWDQTKLFAAFNAVVVTTDGGAHWTRLSPDLAVRPEAGRATPPRAPGARDAILSMALSPVAPGTIWVGTNNGLIHLTRDEGKTWTNVSVASLPRPERANVSGIEASPFDAGTAYVAIESLRLGDHRPHLFRTRDFGASWTEINEGLPVDEVSGSITRVIRADPKRRGLLFAGTESGVRVSFDDGDHWQSLKLNMPDTPCWDLTIKGNDLIVGTYGRGIWVLDTYSLLRQLNPGMETSPARLFASEEAIRVRRNVSDDTPLPPEIPHAKNAPDGVSIDYWLGERPKNDITLDVVDASGRVVRHLSSAPIPPVAEIPRVSFPEYWLARPKGMPTAIGTNRITWDMRYDAPRVFQHEFEINANPGLTPASPEGPLALPGVYTARLTVDGARHEQKVVVRNDPRSPATAPALQAQHALLMGLYDAINAAWDLERRADALRAAADEAASGAPSEVGTAAAAFKTTLDAAARAERPGALTLRGVSGTLARQLTAQDKGDHAPTAPMLAAYAATCRDLTSVQTQWSKAVDSGVGAFNAVLARLGRRPVAAGATATVACRAMGGAEGTQAPTVQYKSPAGVEYRSLPDTEAVTKARAALASEPRNVSRIIDLGVALSGARQFREAIDVFTRGLEIQPDNALLLRWRGHRYISVREFERARVDLTRAAKLDPSIYGIWFHLGVVQYLSGEFTDAAASFTHAQPMAPDANELAGSTDWLWMSLSRAGRSAEAKAVLDRRSDTLPKDYAYTRRLQLYAGAVAPENLLTAADTDDVQIATLSYGLGNWYLIRGDKTRARAYFERAVASGGWPGFGFILAEVELKRLR